MFGLHHFLFLLITIALGSVIVYIFYAKLKDENKRTLALKILAGIWFSFGLAHQIVYAAEVMRGPNLAGWTWPQLMLPFTYCSFLSIVTPLVIIFFKKDNRALHCLTYFSFFGGFSIFFPAWLNDNVTFFLPSSILAMFHHAFMLLTSILLITTKYIKPSMKRFYIYPVGVAMIILLGVLEKYVLKFPIGMMIGVPLFDKMPHLTSWWGLWLGGSFLVLVFLFLYEFMVYKKEAKEIFDVRGIFDDFTFIKNKDKKDKKDKKKK